MIGTYIVVALVAYLLGSIPFGYVLLRLFRGQDVRATGSGNIGATNVARSAPGLGLLTLVLDAGKGFLAVLFAGVVSRPDLLADIGIHLPGSASVFSSMDQSFRLGLAGLLAVTGHMYPVWLRFRGGKGVATALGSFAPFAPKAALLAILVFFLVVVVFRYVSLGSMVGCVAFPVAAYVIEPRIDRWPIHFAIVVVSVLVIWKHKENIRRLLAGTENRFTLKRTGA